MARSAILVESAGHAVLQDLGRPGYTRIGIPANGASDHHSARTSNILVGNAQTAPMIEVTGSELTFVAQSELLLAVTGAANHVLIDGAVQPAWEPLIVFPGASVTVPAGHLGLRSYVAINGRLESETALGSVAPDHLLGVGRRLARGDNLQIQTAYRTYPLGHQAPMFRLAAPRLRLSKVAEVDATPGPELSRMSRGADCLSEAFEVSPQSDHIGLRLLGPAIEQTSTAEILSRGVPVGAIQVPPAGGIIMLLRGRLVTAGYPVVGVVTSASLDRLGQARPGDTVRVRFTDVATAQAKLKAQDCGRRELAQRVERAFSSAGLGGILDPISRS